VHSELILKEHRNVAKTYVLDTNVLLHDPAALFAFGDHRVVIPFAVIEEIDNQKKRQDEIGRNARIISRQLDDMRSIGRLSEGIPMSNNGILYIELNHQACINFPEVLDPEKYDNRILAVAHNLKQEGNSSVVLVTKDLNLRIKADVLGIAAEDFLNDKVDFCSLYSGYRDLYVTAEDLAAFYRDGGLALGNHPTPFPHEFLVLKNLENPSQSALGRYTGSAISPVIKDGTTHWGIRARNKEQRFAMDLLLDDTVPVVTLLGKAGTGKTLLALAVALEKVLEEKAYSRVLVTRPVIPVGDDIGYLPGNKEEKLRPWMQPIYDNLELLLRMCPKIDRSTEELLCNGALEMEALTYIRGRSIPNQFIVCDEAQNLSPNMVKALITRVGAGTKIVFTGDAEQIDHPYLDASSNGLTYLVERFKHVDIAGHVTLVKGERSEVAELGARLL
jgi:PhoH-like ATPase